jgi:hypothetical protein
MGVSIHLTQSSIDIDNADLSSVLERDESHLFVRGIVEIEKIDDDRGVLVVSVTGGRRFFTVNEPVAGSLVPLVFLGESVSAIPVSLWDDEPVETNDQLCNLFKSIG